MRALQKSFELWHDSLQHHIFPSVLGRKITGWKWKVLQPDWTHTYKPDSSRADRSVRCVWMNHITLYSKWKQSTQPRKKKGKKSYIWSIKCGAWHDFMRSVMRSMTADCSRIQCETATLISDPLQKSPHVENFGQCLDFITTILCLRHQLWNKRSPNSWTWQLMLEVFQPLDHTRRCL